MVLYRCTYCGSPNVSKQTKREGYSVKKGLVGGLMFGSIGALMGVNGKEKVYYHCVDCGADATSPMSPALKASLESYLREPEKYETLLEYEKKMYRNIEWEKPIRHTPIGVDKNEKVIANNENTLADEIWQYYLKCKIPYMSISSIVSNTQSSDANVRKAMKVLESRGLVVPDDDSYTFYDDAENIKNNVKNYQSKQKQKNDDSENSNRETNSDLNFIVKTDTIEDPRRLRAIKKFISSNKTREVLRAYCPCEDGGIYITDSYMAFKLKCNYLPFNVAFNNNYSQKDSYIKKYENKYLNIMKGSYPNMKNIMDLDNAKDVIKFNLEELKAKEKLKEKTIIYDTSGDYKIMFDISRLILLTKILGIKDQTFTGFASVARRAVYILNENGEIGLILPINN